MSRRPRPTVARPSPLGYVASLLFHLLIVVGTLIAFRHTFDAAPETHAVPVDLVTFAERTNVRAEAPPQPKPEKPTPAANEPPPLPQFQQTEPSPDVTMPKFKVRPETKKETLQDADALLNKLFTPQKAPPKNVKAGPRTTTGIGAMNGMTADLADTLKSQIYRCWSPPVGAPNANDLVTDFDLALNPDGGVASVKPSMGTSMRLGNPYTRAAEEAALRAINTCAPYKLPVDRYAQWRDVSPLRFDPREMMGQ